MLFKFKKKIKKKRIEKNIDDKYDTHYDDDDFIATDVIDVNELDFDKLIRKLQKYIIAKSKNFEKFIFNELQNLKKFVN